MKSYWERYIVTARRMTALVAVAIGLTPFCWGWGREGHQIVARIAENYVDETTKVMIQSLIGNNHLYSIASWADDVRKERPDTAPWHYVEFRSAEPTTLNVIVPLRIAVS